jgi:GAF domain-containing protein
LPEGLALARQAPRETSICGHVVAENEIVVIEDTHKDKRFATNEFLRERGIRFYAGAPLRSRNGQAIGTLCVLDTVPRTFSATERSLLQVIADDVMTAIQEVDVAEVSPGEGAGANSANAAASLGRRAE